MGAIINGLKYALDGKGASLETRTKYQIPWNTKERAITGGAIFIGSSYINIGQNTIYLQKFHVSDNKGGELFWHQYMTNVLAPYSESNSIYKGYLNSNLLNSDMTFIIPIYNNMPDLPCKRPSILDKDYIKDNTKVYADVTNTLNIRSGPSTSYETIVTVTKNDKMTRIEKGVQNGELWDRVQLENGIVGYAFQNYLKEVKEVQVQEIKLTLDKETINKNESIKLNVEILPKDASNQKITFYSENPNIASVDENGNIIALSSGETKIFAKASNNVSSSIKIKVYSKVEDLEVNASNLKLMEKETFNLIVTVYPNDASNKNLIYESSNNNIVTVDNQGKIAAIKQGNAVVTVKSQDSNIKKEIEVEVLENIPKEELKFDENLRIDGNIISNLDYKNMTVSKIKSYITTIYTVQIENHKGEVLKDNELAGTGSKIKIINEKGEVKAKYLILLYGDVTGDGKINSVDLLVLQRHILEIQKIDEIFKKAGNIKKDGKKPTSVDLLLIQRHILELKLIEQ